MSKHKRPQEHPVPSLMDTIADPHAFVLSLIGAEVLATKSEDGPLARPWRSIRTRAGIPAGISGKEGSRG